MINIKSIKKENNNNYFVIYTKNREVFTYGGTLKEVLEELTKDFKKGNINDK
jgi:predicted RNase H-like HicB family nuclease